MDADLSMLSLDVLRSNILPYLDIRTLYLLRNDSDQDYENFRHSMENSQKLDVLLTGIEFDDAELFLAGTRGAFITNRYDEQNSELMGDLLSLICNRRALNVFEVFLPNINYISSSERLVYQPDFLVSLRNDGRFIEYLNNFLRGFVHPMMGLESGIMRYTKSAISDASTITESNTNLNNVQVFLYGLFAAIDMLLISGKNTEASQLFPEKDHLLENYRLLVSNGYTGRDRVKYEPFYSVSLALLDTSKPMSEYSLFGLWLRRNLSVAWYTEFVTAMRESLELPVELRSNATVQRLLMSPVFQGNI